MPSVRPSQRESGPARNPIDPAAIESQRFLFQGVPLALRPPLEAGESGFTEGDFDLIVSEEIHFHGARRHMSVTGREAAGASERRPIASVFDDAGDTLGLSGSNGIYNKILKIIFEQCPQVFLRYTQLKQVGVVPSEFIPDVADLTPVLRS